jgi:hypothetical protein
MELSKTGREIVVRIELDHDRIQWKALVNTVMNFAAEQLSAYQGLCSM